jgi:hypothetical protein
MNARHLTDYPLDGYLHTRRSGRVMLRRDKFNLKPLFESVGWVLAGATLGSVAVMLGAWGLINLTEPRPAPKTVVAMTYQAPAESPR